MLDFLLGYLRELGDRALKVDGLFNDFAVKVDWVGGDFRYHVLLGEVESLLVLKIDVDFRVLPTVNLTVFGPVCSSCTPNL